MRCVYLRMDTHDDWKDYQFTDDSEQVENDDVDVEEDEIVEKSRSPSRIRCCSHKGCTKTTWSRGMCYRHAQEQASKRGVPIGDTSSDDEDEIYTVRAAMRTIGTQTDDVPFVSDNSGHYAASIASDSSSSSSDNTQARGLPKDDTTVDENSSSSGDNSQMAPVRRKQHHGAKHVPEEVANGTEPHINDVLLVAGHHSHMGNVQFCNAVRMCNTDFSVVPECFSDALKSLSPPGRFLVKSVSDGRWKEISHDLAPSIIPLIMDHHKLKSTHLYQRESLSFLARVERQIESKYGGPCLLAKEAPERSLTLPEATLPATAVTAETPAVATAPIANTKEAVTNRCIAQTLQTFNIWNDENWRNNTLAAFGVDTAKLTQDGASLNQLSAETLSEILEQSSLSAHTLLTFVFDAEVKSLVKSHDALVV